MTLPDLRTDRRGGIKGVIQATILGAILIGMLAFVIGGLANVGLGIFFGFVGAFLGAILVGVVALIVNSAIEIVDPYEKRVLTVFGDFREVLGPGLHLVPPLVNETHNFDMRTHTVNVPSQEAITRDNSPVVANAILYIRVMDAKKAFLEVENYRRAVSNLSQTTLRAVLGDMELDETLSKRREINEKIRKEIDEATDQWGVRVESVEVQEITPSTDVLQSMEKQTSAERKRRAMILEAQGERRASIERAEGDKQSDIIEAQGEKQAQILEAQGDSISTVLRSRSADAMGEQAVIDKSMDTLQEIGEGPSETYVLPQELSSAVGKYGKQFAGVTEGEGLEGKEYDEQDREILGLDDIDEIVGEVENIEEEAVRAAEEAMGAEAEMEPEAND